MKIVSTHDYIDQVTEMERAFLERNSVYNIMCYLADNGKGDTELGKQWMVRYQKALMNYEIASKKFELAVVKDIMKDEPYMNWEIVFGEEKIYIS